MKKELVNDTKVWKIETKGTSHTVEFGKVGGKLRTNEKTFKSEEDCQKNAEKLIASKLKGGYIELSLKIEGVPLDFLYKIEQVQRGNATSISEDTIYVDNKDVLAAICLCTHLEDLSIKIVDDVDIEIPEEIGELSNLKKLELFTDEELLIPSSIYKLTNLEDLTLSEFANTELPKDIGNLYKLKKLELDGFSKLESLPPSIGDLKQLKALSITRSRDPYADSKLPGLIIPKEIGDLKQLTTLDLSENAIESLPDEIENLKALTELNIEENAFDHFPLGICKLIHLQSLYMSDQETASNQPITISYIPEAIINLENLESLSIDFNIPKHFRMDSDEMDPIINYFKYYVKKQDTTIVKEIPNVPSNSEQLLKDRQDILDEAFSKISSRILYEHDRFNELKNYITGKSNELPIAYLSDSTYIFGFIIDILAPLKSWNFIDKRIFSFITQDAFFFEKKHLGKKKRFFEGYHQNLFKNWFLPQLENEQANEDLLHDVFELLKKEGIEDTICFEAFLSAIPYKKVPFNNADGILNSIGKYILNKAQSNLDATTDLIIKHERQNQFAKLMLENAPKLLEQSLPKMLVIDECKGSVSANKLNLFKLLELLVAYDVKAYEHYIHKFLAKTDCYESIMECYRILLEYNETEYKNATRLKIEETLTIISERKKKDETYKFSWSKTSTYFVLDNTVDFIDWSLKKYGTTLKEAIIQYLRNNTKSDDLRILKVIGNYFKQDALEIIQPNFKVDTTTKNAIEYYTSLLGIFGQLDFSIYYDEVWKLALNKEEKIAKVAIFELAKTQDTNVKAKAFEYLKSKKDVERLVAMRVCNLWHDKEGIKEALLPLLKTETKDTIRELVVAIIYSQQNINEVAVKEMKERIQMATNLQKLNTPLLPWLDKLPPLKWLDGSLFSKQEINYIFYRQNLCKTLEADIEAAPIYYLVEEKSAQLFAKSFWVLLDQNKDINTPVGIWANEGFNKAFSRKST